MKPQFSPEELARWISKRWENGMPEVPITGISKDTRTLMPGDLYIALRGENFDGHDFVADAFSKGAAAALVADDFQWLENPVLQVPDTLKGLQDLARGYRSTWDCVVIGITGSVGKTTVKEMCADVLSMDGETHRTAGNYNNHIGLPLTMLALPQTVKYGVFEIGMNHPGEIAALTDLLQPEIGILTDICNAHRENFQSLEAIAREKAELAWRLPNTGTAILDADSEWYKLICSRTAARVVTLPQSINPQQFPMPLPGEHVMRNALRAIALGLELGLAPEQVAEGLMKYAPPPMRWQESTVDGIAFINDAYNANPLSMRANLRTFAELPGSGKKWAVVGGMRELGDTAEDEHAELGRFIDDLPLDGVIVVGELGQQIVCNQVENFFQCLEAAEAAQLLRDNLAPGDHVLLKASRGEHLEQVLDQFKKG